MLRDEPLGCVLADDLRLGGLDGHDVTLADVGCGP